MSGRVDLIREAAYLIWEREGRPAGRHLEHWLEAEASVGTGTLEPPTVPARRKRTPTKRTTAKKAVEASNDTGAKAKPKSKAKTTKKSTTRRRKKT